MVTKNVMYFTDREVEFVHLLVKIGIQRTVAMVLVFLANTTGATSRDIERGTDLRQPEVSSAMKFLTCRAWVKSHEIPQEHKSGRPSRVYELAKPITGIMDCIEKETKDKANDQLALFTKLQEYLP
jgi:predicted transcriptional regulator